MQSKVWLHCGGTRALASWQGPTDAYKRARNRLERSVSDTDSFIDEVSEEVRREKLYGYLRRYGWIAILLVLLLVAGTSFNEYRKAQAKSGAEAKGDAILNVLEEDEGPSRLAAFAQLPEELQSAPVVAMLHASEALAAEDPDAAAQLLRGVIDDPDQPQLYRDIAVLKHTIITSETTDPAARIAALAQLTVPGGAFRTLAEEQIALAELDNGDRDAALARLRALLVDTETSQGLRIRAQQLIVALGASVEPT